MCRVPYILRHRRRRWVGYLIRDGSTCPSLEFGWSYSTKRQRNRIKWIRFFVIWEWNATDCETKSFWRFYSISNYSLLCSIHLSGNGVGCMPIIIMAIKARHDHNGVICSQSRLQVRPITLTTSTTTSIQGTSIIKWTIIEVHWASPNEHSTPLCTYNG